MLIFIFLILIKYSKAFYYVRCLKMKFANYFIMGLYYTFLNDLIMERKP